MPMTSCKSKIVGVVFGIALMFGSSAATAQDGAEAAATEDEKVLDEVTVTGVQNDAAMAAFRAGDYITAEIEFLDNAMCALRRERNQFASIDSARINADRAETFANATGVDSGANSRGGSAGQPNDIPTGIAASSGVAARNVQTATDRTCENRGRQLYFAGLSQLQLGKNDDALRNFEKAVVASKVLYDAHYKIGLIKLLEGDTRGAKAQLRKVEGILKRCRNCEARDEITARRDFLERAIKGEVALQ